MVQFYENGINLRKLSALFNFANSSSMFASLEMSESRSSCHFKFLSQKQDETYDQGLVYVTFSL